MEYPTLLTLQPNEEPGMVLRTRNTIFKYTFKWVIEKLSKICLSYTDSPKFQVEPKSRWHVSLAKEAQSIGLFLNRHFDDMGVKIYFSVRLSDAVSKALYYNEGTLVPYSEDSRFALFDDVVTDRMDKIMKPVYDRLFIQIHLEVIGQVTKEVSPTRLLPLTMKHILDIAVKTDMAVIEELDEKPHHRASMITRSVFFINMLSRMLSANPEEMDEGSWENFQDILTFMNIELLEDVDFDTAAGLYKAANQYLLTDLKNECKDILISKITPTNTQRVLDLLKNDS